MSQSAAAEPRLARLTVDQVRSMLEAGILKEGEPIELIAGLLVCKDRSAEGEDPMTVGKRHNLVIKLLAELGVELAERGCHMQTQGPLVIPPHDEPEPDGAVLRGGPRTYAERLPGVEDAESVIEVSDSSLVYDRTTKLALYARAGVSQYVIVNLREDTVEVREDPEPKEARFRSTVVLSRADSLQLRVAEETFLNVPVKQILP